MINFIKNHIKFIFIFILLFVCIVVGLFSYNDNLRNDLEESTCQTLTEVIEQQKFNFSNQISTNVNSLKNLAISIRYTPITKNREYTLSIINALLENTDFEHLVITGNTGVGIVSTGGTIDISDREYFIKSIKGETVISPPVKSKVDGAVILPISTPIYIGDNIVGTISGYYSTDKLTDLILPSFNNKGYTYIVDSTGSIIASQNSDFSLITDTSKVNFFNALEYTTTIRYDSTHDIIENIRKNKSGHSTFSVDKQERYMHYTPLNINDWYVFAIIPDDIITATSSDILLKAISLTIIFIIIVFLFILYILLMQRKSNKQRQAHTARIEKYAFFDELTGLPNLTKFKIDTRQIVKQNPDVKFVIVKFDILNFKMINEMFGFSTGDVVVKYIANTLQRIRDIDGRDFAFFCRVNADEFLMFDEFDTIEDLDGRTKFLDDLFSLEMSQILNYHKITFRFGRYFFDKGEVDIAGAIEKANIAHRLSKLNKQIQTCNYDSSFKKRVIHETEVENSMEGALLNNEFCVYLQPKYELKTETVVGAEALVRWKKSDGTIVPPGDFIPLFERNGFITNLDIYMFSQVCKIISSWIENGLPVVTISVNFSRLHLSNNHFVHELVQIASRYNVPTKYIEIELTETVIFDNEYVFGNLLFELHKAGFTLSMDDFGTGYSSLGLLKNLAVDVIKIDKGFLTDVKYESRSRVVLESILQMAKKLEIHTVAEGVETKEHIDLLKEIGCDIVQGYYYSKPFPADEFFDEKHIFKHDEFDE